MPRRRLNEGPREQDQSESFAQPQAIFRRNQTITGSSSSAVSSVASSDATMVSPRQRAHELRKRRRSLFMLFGATLTGVILLFVLLQESVLTTNVALYGQVGALNADQAKALQSTIGEFYADNPLQRFRPAFSSAKLVTFMAQHGHSEISSVISVQPSGISSATITLKAREPIASWTIDGTQYFVDNNGVVFKTNFYATPSIRIVDNSGTVPQQGVVASNQLLEFIGMATGKMKGYGFTIKEIDLPPDTTREVILVLTTGQQVKMTIDRSAGEQCEDAARALQYFQTNHVTIHYVDVRVSREAFYQ